MLTATFSASLNIRCFSESSEHKNVFKSKYQNLVFEVRVETAAVENQTDGDEVSVLISAPEK